MAQLVSVSLKEAEVHQFVRAAEDFQLSIPMVIKSLALQRLKQLKNGESVLVGGR